MHLGTAALLDFHARHRDEDYLVLATITRTEGSTYRKPGAMMLMTAGGCYEGLISGGCLEGDLLEHAAGVFATGESRRVVYDMHSDEDLVWGLGIGCDGVIELALCRLDLDTHRALFDAIGSAHAAGRRVMLALDTGPAGCGSLATLDEDGRITGDAGLASVALNAVKTGWPETRFIHSSAESGPVILVNLVPQPRVLLCGGGPDAVPVAVQCASLGWPCTVADHRPAFANPERFPAGTETVLSRPPALHETVSLADFAAAVIMSHNLENDAQYLRQLAPLAQTGSLHYLGILGPSARRKRLAEMAGCPEVLIHGPVGLDIGAELPEAIALSVVAEIHAVLNRRDGQSLTTGPVGQGVDRSG